MNDSPQEDVIPAVQLPTPSRKPRVPESEDTSQDMSEEAASGSEGTTTPPAVETSETESASTPRSESNSRSIPVLPHHPCYDQ